MFVVDDDEAVRDSLRALLETQGYQVKTYDSAEAFLADGPPGQGGCAIVDLRMPGIDGLELLGRLRAGGTELPVVMVTGHGDVPLAVKAMKSGAADFVEKPYSNEVILEVVRRAADRSSYERAGPKAKTAAEGIVASLTPRERDVLEQLVAGHPNKIIAFKLGISPRTVEIHRANLMKKMQVNNLSQLIRLALAAGINPEPA